MVKQLALMQLHHLSAAVLQSRYKRALARIEAVHNIRALLLQQNLKTLLMLLAPPEITRQLLHERPAVVIGIIDPEVNHLHPVRERIEGRPAMLVCRNDGHIPAFLLNKVTYLIEKDALHSAWVICRVDLIEYLHLPFRIHHYLPC